MTKIPGTITKIFNVTLFVMRVTLLVMFLVAFVWSLTQPLVTEEPMPNPQHETR